MYNAGESFSEMAHGLKPDTTYYYRSCGQDFNYPGHPRIDGNIVSFRTDSNNDTDPILGELNTKSARNISKNSALLRGEVTEGRKIDT